MPVTKPHYILSQKSFAEIMNNIEIIKSVIQLPKINEIEKQLKMSRVVMQEYPDLDIPSFISANPNDISTYDFASNTGTKEMNRIYPSLGRALDTMEYNINTNKNLAPYELRAIAVRTVYGTDDDLQDYYDYDIKFIMAHRNTHALIPNTVFDAWINACTNYYNENESMDSVITKFNANTYANERLVDIMRYKMK